MARKRRECWVGAGADSGVETSLSLRLPHICTGAAFRVRAGNASPITHTVEPFQHVERYRSMGGERLVGVAVDRGAAGRCVAEETVDMYARAFLERGLCGMCGDRASTVDATFGVVRVDHFFHEEGIVELELDVWPIVVEVSSVRARDDRDGLKVEFKLGLGRRARSFPRLYQVGAVPVSPAQPARFSSRWSAVARTARERAGGTTCAVHAELGGRELCLDGGMCGALGRYNEQSGCRQGWGTSSRAEHISAPPIVVVLVDGGFRECVLRLHGGFATPIVCLLREKTTQAVDAAMTSTSGCDAWTNTFFPFLLTAAVLVFSSDEV
ncbi:hypothetical protein B0H16DRAFT_1788081 [Mycena metata]|uniref:Uncharacterized protein n=1 Tax=Mycena metata TaxID=1033252 RepID=A0AAD7HL04_9AGAR|nr:hypothetical protein B0H16DRAFT_1788081 [Mycena metata]